MVLPGLFESAIIRPCPKPSLCFLIREGRVACAVCFRANASPDACRTFQRRFPAMYKPNFCAECGERIARSRWHFWTSRRFCTGCAPRFRAARIILPLVAGASFFTLGLGAGRAVRPAPPPLILERRQPAVAATQAAPLQPAQARAKTENAPAPAGPEPEASANTARSTAASETVSICGALTKKGTPCQRRVRGTDRCWQHKGQPAVIPLEERIVKGK